MPTINHNSSLGVTIGVDPAFPSCGASTSDTLMIATNNFGPLGNFVSAVISAGTPPPGVEPLACPTSGMSRVWMVGTPAAVGTYDYTVFITRGDASTFTQDVHHVIALVGGCPLITINPPEEIADYGDHLLVGGDYDLIFTAEDGAAPYGSWEVVDGALPDGMTLTTNGHLIGTPTTADDYDVTIRTIDNNGCPGVLVMTITVIEPDPIIVHPDDPILVPGTRLAPYTLLFTATGGAGAPYDFTITDGELPPGLTLALTGVLAGIPTEAGRFVFTVRATDALDLFGEREYTLDIAGLRIVLDGDEIISGGELESADLELGLNRQATGKLVFGDPTVIPNRAVDVLVYARDGVTPIFSGLLIVRSVGGMSPGNPANKVSADLVDYSIFFEDADPITIVNTAPQYLEDVIAEIVSQSLAVYGITYDAAPTGQTVPPIEWTEITVPDAFKRITDATGVVFRVRPRLVLGVLQTKALDVFVPLADPAPTAITDALIASDAVAFDLSWRDPAGLPKNTVDLTCGPTGNGVATQQWEADGYVDSWEVDIQAVIGNAEPAHTANAYLSPVGATNFSDGDTIGLGSSTYTFRTALVGDVAGEVLIGASVTDSLANLNAAINLAGGGVYAPSTPANADAFSFLPYADRLEARALTAGAAGNSISVTSSHEAVAFWYGEGGIPRSTFQLGSDATGVAGWTQGYILETLAGASVARTISNAPDTSGYYVWNVLDGRGTISVGDAGTTPPVYTILELKYLAVFPFHAIYSTGTPPRTFREAHPEIVSYADGLALAQRIHARESADRRELEVFTDVDGLLPGQALTVDTSYRGGFYDEEFLVATVRIKLVNAELWEYSATCQETDEYAGSFVEQWKALTSGSSSSATQPATIDGGGATVAGDIYSDGRQSFRADQSFGGHKARHVDDPAVDDDAATKGYVDTADAATLYDANAYTDAALAGGVILADGSVPMAADLSLGGNKITDLDTPVDPSDAVTKAYADSIVSGGSGDRGFMSLGHTSYAQSTVPMVVTPTGTTLTFIVGIGGIGVNDATVYANVMLHDYLPDDTLAVVGTSLVSFGGQHLFGLVHFTGLVAGKQYVASLGYSSRRATAAIGGLPFLVCLDLVTGIAAASLETAEAASSSSFGDLATAGPSATITVPSDGCAAVIFGDSENRVQTGTSMLSVDVSGGTTISAATNGDLVANSTSGAQNLTIQGGFMSGGKLASGSTTFKLQYRSDGGSNTRYARWIAAMIAVFGNTPITFGVSRVLTAETRTNTAYGALATADSVTLTTGTSVLVLFSANIKGSGVIDVSIAVDVSGATTIAAADGVNNAKQICASTASALWHIGRGVVITVNAGSNTFALRYKSGSGTLTASTRILAVIRLN